MKPFNIKYNFRVTSPWRLDMEGWNHSLQSDTQDWTLTVRVVNKGKSGAFSVGLHGGMNYLIFQLNPAKVLGHEVPGLEGASMHLNIPANFIHIQHNRLVSEWREIGKFISAEVVEVTKDGQKCQINKDTLVNIFSDISNNFSTREIC